MGANSAGNSGNLFLLAQLDMEDSPPTVRNRSWNRHRRCSKTPCFELPRPSRRNRKTLHLCRRMSWNEQSSPNAQKSVVFSSWEISWFLCLDVVLVHQIPLPCQCVRAIRPFKQLYRTWIQSLGVDCFVKPLDGRRMDGFSGISQSQHLRFSCETSGKHASLHGSMCFDDQHVSGGLQKV